MSNKTILFVAKQKEKYYKAYNFKVKYVSHNIVTIILQHI